MRFTIEVGEVAKRRIDFAFNQLLGQTLIFVNGQEVKRNVRWISEPVVERHDFTVCERERIEVTIQKRRNPLLGAKYWVYVNKQLMQYHQGM
ncbi:MAG: hypothetical protein WCO56_05430 [Verrucomicrobiota bacterium]